MPRSKRVQRLRVPPAVQVNNRRKTRTTPPAVAPTVRALITRKGKNR